MNETETWENIIEKSKSSVFYKAKCFKPKDGPVKYLSVTVFENCAPEILRDFYMDCDFRKQWDKMVVAHEQLQIDKRTGVEIGRTIKKFPLLMSREYVLDFWHGRTGKAAIRHFTTSQRLVHQEDAGLNVEMAKLAFAKGIWNYVCKMDEALREYASSHHRLSSSAITAVSLSHKVPPELDVISRTESSEVVTVSSNAINGGPEDTGGAKSQKINTMPTKKMIANGLLLLGSLICLSHGNSSLGAKVAVAYVLKKFCKH